MFLTSTFTWVTGIATSDTELLLVAAAWWQLFVTFGCECYCGQPLHLLLWWFCCSCECVTSDGWMTVNNELQYSRPIPSCGLRFRRRCWRLTMFHTRTGRVTAWLAFGIQIKPNVFKWGKFVISVANVTSDISKLPKMFTSPVTYTLIPEVTWHIYCSQFKHIDVRSSRQITNASFTV